MNTIPIPLPFEKGRERELPPHLDPSNQFYESSPAASSSSTPIPRFSSAHPSIQQSGHPMVIDNSQDEDPSAGPEEEENIFRDMSWEEILEDLNARFLINLPKEEMSLVRVYWQAEQAHWFYEDYLRPLNPLLPSLSQRNFTRIIIESSPLYAALMAQGGVDYDQVWEEYCSYKRMVPCCGGILINKDGDKCLMVRGYKSSAGWCFPRGKINLEEEEEACAIREVEEETGFDLTGLTNPADKIKTHINAQEVTMFIVKGIDEATVFKTQTRNEIGAIEWVKLTDLPTWINKKGPKRTGGQGQKKFYNVTPFVTPLKHWLKEHGIDPYMKPKKKVQPASNYRDLQPYQFDSSSPHPASPVLSHSSSALDHLFSRFIHKQEEELSAPTQQAVIGSDNKAGLERLFGNLNVLKEEEESLANKVDSGLSDHEREQNEDDALARLLGGIGIAQTPAPQPPKPTPATQNQNNLLAMLNSRPSGPSTSTQQVRVPESPAKPHQAKLLAMISPPPASASIKSHPSKPMSLPTSPRPSSAAGAVEETQRQAKARALLDMTIAGIGIVVPANSAHQMESLNMSHPAFLPPLPQPGSAGRVNNVNSGTVTRITPPGAGYMPSVHQPPPSTYTHSQGYRPTTQPPIGSYNGPRPPASTSNQPQVPYGASPHRISQPPPPYEATNQNQHRGGSMDYGPFGGSVHPAYDQRTIQSQGINSYQNGINATNGPNPRPPPGPPGMANLANTQAFRPMSNPVPGVNYGMNYGSMGGLGAGPHPPHQYLPPSSLQGGFAPPPLANSHMNVQGPSQINSLFQPRPPMGLSMPISTNNVAYQSQHHSFPSHGPLPQLNPSQSQYSAPRGSPPKAPTSNNSGVIHPIPRPAQAQGAALLAMINGDKQGR
ncbi:uncharacterized protein IL334_000736 [Kwoniella shivajii]|uniref:Nudix hydrolase domain-containing protein n=1 Tax=Kwoniella shivajii TaxID=564305 RepID=A0ABZ1CQ67_9TREE|nr:hypothetical protein IL334_000736 [Kwoniella shivajii]